MVKELGVIGILRESSRALLINVKLILPMALLLLIPPGLLRYIPGLNPPLSFSFIVSNLGFPKLKKLELTLWPIGFVFSYLISSSTIYISVLACTGSHFGLSELASKIKRTWKWLAVTLLQTKLITQAFVFLWSIIQTLLNSKSTYEDSDSLSLLFGGLLVLVVAGGLLIYLVLLAKVSHVVVVMEEGCYGLDALARANGLMRRRKMKLFLLSGILSVMTKGVEVLARIVVVGGVGNLRLPPPAAVVPAVVAKIMLVLVSSTLMEIFRSIAAGVYYLECKKGVGRRRAGKEAGKREILDFNPFKSDAAINSS